MKVYAPLSLVVLLLHFVLPVTNCAYGAAPDENIEGPRLYRREKLPDNSTSIEIDRWRKDLLRIKELTFDLLEECDKKYSEESEGGNTTAFLSKLKVLVKTIEAGLAHTEKTNLLAYGYEKICVTKNVSIISERETIRECLLSFYSLFPESTFEELSRKFAQYTEDLDCRDFHTVTCDSLNVKLYQQVLACRNFNATAQMLEGLVPDYLKTLKDFLASEFLENTRKAQQQSQADLERLSEQLKRSLIQRFNIVRELLNQEVAFGTYKLDVLYPNLFEYYLKITSLFVVSPEVETQKES